MSLTTGQCATLACLLEVTAPKPGNVHRGADFEDLSFGDFLVAATMIGPPMAAAASQRVGQTVLESVKTTRAATGTNVNLGMILLLAPLAAVPHSEPLDGGVQRVLAGLSADDARDVYEAIRLAQPGGLGKAESHDVNDAPPSDLLVAMSMAADRDLVARQYANGYAEVLGVILPNLKASLVQGLSLPDAIVHLHLQTMSEFPDSLIGRKCGETVARQAADHARYVLSGGAPGDENYERGLADLDFWLRSDHHRRNPGTTADLIAASLFVALREGIIEQPIRWR